MKLIKINTEHYIIVDDSEIDYDNEPYLLIKDDYETYIHKHKGDNKPTTEHYKITHSTQPLEFENVKVFDKEWEEGYFDKIQPLNLSEVKELIGEVNVENMAESRFGTDIGSIRGSKEYDLNTDLKRGFILGYNQALGDNKEKTIMFICKYLGAEKHSQVYNKIIKDWEQSLQPETEWNVEFIDGKLKLKQ